MQSSKSVRSNVRGEIATFELSSFDKFALSYQNTTSLAPEILEALDQFLPALDKFFDLMDSIEFDISNLIMVWICGDFWW